MRSLSRFLLLLLAMLSWPSHANLEYDLQSQPQVSNAVKDLDNRINALPDPLFMDELDKRKVNTLLAEVLRVQNQQITTFDQQLLAYKENNNVDLWFAVESSYVTLNSLNVSSSTCLNRRPLQTKNA